MFYSGTDGKLFINGDTAAKVRSWSFSSSLGLLDTTTLGDTDSTSTPGIRTNTGSCSLFYYATANPDYVNSASVLINKIIKAGTEGVAAESEEVILRLAITNSDVNVGIRYIEGPVFLTSVSMTCAVGEVLSADVAFQVNGAFTGVVL